MFRVLPVTVDMQQEVGGADGESDLVPEAVGEAVGEGLGAWLAFEAVVVTDLLSHSAALQLKVTAAEEGRRDVRVFIIWVMHMLRDFRSIPVRLEGISQS